MTTCPNLENAKLIAENLIEERSAACVQVIEGVTSFFRLEGKASEEKEILVLIKTFRENFKNVSKLIKSVHPYETPEVVCLPIAECSEAYLNWMKKEVQI